MRVTNGIPLGSPLLLPVGTVICVATLKATQKGRRGKGGIGLVVGLIMLVLVLIGVVTCIAVRMNTDDKPAAGDVGTVLVDQTC
jgi:hypothetical protein